MFSVIELRLIHYCVSKALEEFDERLKTIDPDSDASVELGNDTKLLESILEKIAAREDV